MNLENLKRDIFSKLEQRLSSELCYHDVYHTRSVMSAAETIARHEGATDCEIHTLIAAALLHDTGFLVRYNKNEPVGCDIAQSLLVKYGYDEKTIEIIKSAIKATAMPQNPKTYLERILCDADLNYLGTDDYFSISKLYRKELENQGLIYPEDKWLLFQIDFMEHHKFFTNFGREFREPVKLRHVEELKLKLSKLSDSRE